MYYKLARENVRKSFRDYLIYFLTLTLAVSIFYSFNALESQQALLELTRSEAQALQLLTDLIGYVSIFISVILGSLILYANNFLIKRRHHELGIYLTLGMSKAKISRILMLETLLVGCVALVSGIVLGIIISQGLSLLVANLFTVSMREYQFVFSLSALLKTGGYFSLMFLIVMLFNTYIVAKYRIIDLLTTSQKPETMRLTNRWLLSGSMLASLGLLGVAYLLGLKAGLNLGDGRLWLAVGFGIVGTLGCFYSLAGFSRVVLTKWQGYYLKGLNMFSVQQINRKVQTNFVSMSLICLMLALTMVVLSTGLSFKSAMETSLANATPYDASAVLYPEADRPITSVTNALAEVGVSFGADDVVEVAIYQTELTIGEFLPHLTHAQYGDVNVEFIKQSDYTRLQVLRGEMPTAFPAQTVRVLSNFEKIVPDVNAFLASQPIIPLFGTDYTVENKAAIAENLATDFLQNDFLTLVVPDAVCEQATLSHTILNINYANGAEAESEARYAQVFERYINGEIDYEQSGPVYVKTKIDLYTESKGTTTTIVFVGIYIGLVFLISSMAILALQQLSEASESRERYVALRRLGATKKQLNQTIFKQTLVYFSLPMALALVHAVVGVQMVNEFIAIYQQPNIAGAATVTLIIFALVYSLYFYATYTGAKTIIHAQNE